MVWRRAEAISFSCAMGCNHLAVASWALILDPPAKIKVHLTCRVVASTTYARGIDFTETFVNHQHLFISELNRFQVAYVILSSPQACP